MAHTLLLADDSVTIHRVIELTFADEDVRVVAACDGEEAISILDRTPPDIVLADVTMPGRDGYEVAQHVKDTPALSHIPVVLLTGAFEPVDQERAAAVGSAGVLAKPFEPQMVVARVKELLARPKPAAAAAGHARGDEGRPGHRRMPLPADDDYFARLDQAFATLSAAPGEPSADWLSANRSPGAPDAPMPVTYGSPAADFDRSGTAAESRPTFDDAKAATVPALADAFFGLLRAEEQGSNAAAAAWPSGAPVAVPVTDELIEKVAATVLARLSDRVVRETASELVMNIAERMVREEIQRIKANIK